MLRLRDYKKMHPEKPIRYEGDLEADYIGFLEKVQKAAKENPVEVEFDFPSFPLRCIWASPSRRGTRHSDP